MKRVLLSVILVLFLLGSFVSALQLSTSTVEASSSDQLYVYEKVNGRQLYNFGAVYIDVHNAATGTATGSYIIGQRFTGGQYYIRRAGLLFDTSVLPDDASIIAATLSLYVTTDATDTDFDVVVVSGADLEDPCVDADYGDLLDDIGIPNLGSINTTTLVESSYNNITLTSSALSSITPTGVTKFGIRSSRDINSDIPTGNETFYVDSGIKGGTYFPPRLFVTYTSGQGTVSVWLTSTSDGQISSTNATYTTAQGAAAGTVSDSGNTFIVGQATGFTVYRSGLFIDTSCIPDAANVTAATLYLFIQTDWSTDDFNLTIVDGTALDDPLVGGDFGDLLAVTDSWGYTSSSEMSSGTWTSITMTDGLASISKTGTTELALRSSKDIAAQQPSNSERVAICAFEYNRWNAPRLEITYSIFNGSVVTNAETSLASTSVTLNGIMTDDDGESTVYGYFEWGLTQSFGNSTAQQVITEDVAFTASLTSLPRYTVHYFRAAAMVTGKGAVYGTVRRFITLAETPTVETYNATGVTTVSAVLHGYLSEAGGQNCEWRFRWGTATGVYLWETTWTGDIGDSTSFGYNLYGLAPGKTYSYVAQCKNSAATGSGVEIQFLTNLDNPSITTRPATSVSVTTAILNAFVADDGGEGCYVRFQYGKTAGYGTDTTWVSSYVEGQGAYKQIMSLDANTTYHFRAQIYNTKNGAGSPVSGSDATFATYVSVGLVTNFNVIVNSGVEVSLSWTLGSGSQKTLIRYKTGGYPSTAADGNVAYFGLDASTTLGNLIPGVTYYFAAWGHAPDNYWSSTPVTDVATTSAKGAAAVLLPLPSEPSTWFLNPSTTKIVNMPGFAIIQWQSTQLGVPIGSWCMILAVLAAAFAAGLLLIFTRSSAMALMGATVICFAGAMAGLVPLWIMFAVLVMGISIMYIVPAGRGV